MIVATIAVVGGGAIVSIRPRVRRVCVKCARAAGHAFIVYGYWSNPNARIDWDAVHYAQWLKDHAADNGES